MMASESVTYDHIFKIILVGDNGVGKSSIIRRFCEGSYAQDMDTTIGVDFYLSEIEVDGKKIKVKIWDTAGSEKYMSISAVYYRKADGVIFVFDMTRPRSFTDIVSVWMNAVEAQESGCPEAVKLLVGNKSDLAPEVDVSQIRIVLHSTSCRHGRRHLSTAILLIGFCTCVNINQVPGYKEKDLDVQFTDNYPDTRVSVPALV